MSPAMFMLVPGNHILIRKFQEPGYSKPGKMESFYRGLVNYGYLVDVLQIMARGKFRFWNWSS